MPTIFINTSTARLWWFFDSKRFHFGYLDEDTRAVAALVGTEMLPQIYNTRNIQYGQGQVTPNKTDQCNGYPVFEPKCPKRPPPHFGLHV